MAVLKFCEDVVLPAKPLLVLLAKGNKLVEEMPLEVLEYLLEETPVDKLDELKTVLRLPKPVVAEDVKAVVVPYTEEEGLTFAARVLIVVAAGVE